MVDDVVVVGNLGEMGLRVCKVLDSILASVSGNIFSVDRPHLSNPSISLTPGVTSMPLYAGRDKVMGSVAPTKNSLVS